MGFPVTFCERQRERRDRQDGYARRKAFALRRTSPRAPTYGGDAGALTSGACKGSNQRTSCRAPKGASCASTAHGDLAMTVEGADTTRYSYDALGNLTQVRLPDGTQIGYLLDPQSRRSGWR